MIARAPSARCGSSRSSAAISGATVIVPRARAKAAQAATSASKPGRLAASAVWRRWPSSGSSGARPTSSCDNSRNAGSPAGTACVGAASADRLPPRAAIAARAAAAASKGRRAGPCLTAAASSGTRRNGARMADRLCLAAMAGAAGCHGPQGRAASGAVPETLPMTVAAPSVCTAEHPGIVRFRCTRVGIYPCQPPLTHEGWVGGGWHQSGKGNRPCDRTPTRIIGAFGPRSCAAGMLSRTHRENPRTPPLVDRRPRRT